MITANKILGTVFATAMLMSVSAHAEDYKIDSAGAHASINFKVQHLGYSWLTGRFNKFTGTFSVDEKDPGKAKVVVDIDTTSVSTNHEKRDNHIRSADFLDVAKFPTAKFESTSIDVKGDGKAVVNGKLTMHGVTKDIAIDAEHIGGGKDPWGGVRRGFAGTTMIKMADYGITYNLGPASANVYLDLHIEGIRQ